MIMTEEMTAMIEAIRSNKLVGRGSCSSVDECFDTLELVEALERDKITTPEGAIKWAIELEDLQMERMLNARWGEDDDEQLTIYSEWEERKAEYEY